MKIKMYVLCLLRFKDGSIVFTEPELTIIRAAIAAGLQNQNLLAGGGQNGEPRDGFKVYLLDSNQVQTWVGESATIKSAEIGYYHHRVIVYLRLDSADDFSKLREIRDKLKQPIDDMIKHCVKEQINNLVRLQNVRAEAEVEFFYTYPLIVVKKRPKLRQLVDKMIKCSVKMKKQKKKLVRVRKIRKEAIVKFLTYLVIILKRRLKRSEAFPFSGETSTLYFDIIEQSLCKPPWGRRHMMRISIPGTILNSSRWGVGTELRRDIVNVIYQYCLYEKKSMDKRPFKNALDENLLTNLWTQIVNRMGGRTIEAHTIRLNFLTILLIILTAISVIILLVTVILP